MSDDQFTKLFKYVENRFGDMDKKFEEASKGSADIRGAIGELSARVKDYHNEMIFVSHQVDKLNVAL